MLNVLTGAASRMGAAVLSGVLIALALKLEPIWPLAWIAPLPLLVAAFRARAGEAALLAFVAGVIQGLGSVQYYVATNGAVGGVALIGVMGVLWMIVIIVTRALVVRSRHWLTTLAYPAAWAALDTVLAAVSPHGTMGSIAYSQMDALPVIQIASVAGTAGVVFLMSIPVSVLAIALSEAKPLQPSVAYGLPILMLLGALTYGAVRLATPSESTPITVGLVAIDRSPEQNAGESGNLIWDHYDAAADQLAAQGAQVIVFPETIASIDTAKQAPLAQRLGGKAREHSAYLLAGVGTEDGELKRNRAWVFGPSGKLVADYTKHHLVPGAESPEISPGNGYSVFRVKDFDVGVAICKDMDFPALSRHYGAAGVKALLVPAFDFKVDGWLHSRMAVMRGVENGFSVVRSAEDGLVSVSDPYGRILSEAPSQAAPGAIVVTTAKLSRAVPTLYTAIGDLFGYLCLGSLVLMSGFLLARRRWQLHSQSAPV